MIGLATARSAKKREERAEKRRREEIQEADNAAASAYRDNLRRSGRGQGTVEGGGTFNTALKQVTGIG